MIQEQENKPIVEGIDLAEEVESCSYANTSTANMLLVVNSRKGLKLAIWTKQLVNSRHFLVVSKLVANGICYRASVAIVRDYIDFTHVRNWVFEDAEPLMDSTGYAMFEKFLARHRYTRKPQYTVCYQAMM